MSLRNQTSHKDNLFSKLLIWTGVIFIAAAFIIFILTFYNVIFQEIKYSVKKVSKLREIVPVDKNFGIVIPKIEANAKVIKNINPFNEKEYQWALTKGVAHAVGTALPGHAGNTFIFAHSSEDWYIANRYNSVFYLLHKLEKGDEIDLYYKGNKYMYKVTEKKYVEASDVKYLNNNVVNTATVTLMTCWPPGTTLKRLIVIGQITPKSSLDKMK